VDVEHLAYDTTFFTHTVPLTWTRIVSSGAVYLLLVESANNVLPDSVIAQYMANGGTLTDARGQPVLDKAPLADTLEQFLVAYQAGIITPETMHLSGMDGTWAALVARRAPLANVRASQYLTGTDALPWLGFAPLPARSGPARPIVRGWAIVLITRDPARQPRAAALMMALLAADNAAVGTQALGLLPARPSALDKWNRADVYRAFLRQELYRAIAPPPASVMAVVSPVFQRALADVLGGKVTPEEAAAAAVAQLTGNSP
jgi:ABC-type glycerol-3-phosphate transport system substrate-binding protein